MGDRTVPFKKEARCDDCGAKGAWDFMGDYICTKCLDADYGENPPLLSRAFMAGFRDGFTLGPIRRFIQRIFNRRTK